MKYKELKTSDKEEFLALAETMEMSVLSERYGINTRTGYTWRQKINLEFVDGIDSKALGSPETVIEIISEDKRTIHKLSQENKSLRQALNDAKNHVVDSSDIKELILGVQQVKFNNKIPKWVETVTNGSVIVPVAALSDLHMGETIDPEDMGYGDAYSSQICHDYADKVTNDFIGICKKNMSTYTFPGMVLLLGGDGITGNLHDLAETNDNTPVDQVIEITALYIRVINSLYAAFGKVAVFCVTGNHGRLDSHNYTKTKQRTSNSLETIAYHFVQKHFEKNEDISIITSQSDEILFKINNRRFNLQHGDTIKGGGGIGGIHVPIMRTRAKKLGAAVAVGKAFDTLMIGHFHQHYVSDELIIFNSLKPYDEYSRMMNFSYSRPGMTTFFVNGHGDIIFATDIKIKDENKPVVTKDHIVLF